MNDNPRIQLTDTPKSAMVKLSEGNPGAITVLIGLVTQGPTIDPDAAFGPLAHIFSLDTSGIYGSRIWMFYSDVCKKDLKYMIAVLRAVQLGILDESIMNHAIDNHGKGLNLDEILIKVIECLPDFGKN